MDSILVTGASRGIGLEFVRQYAADGARVIAACRSPDTACLLEELAEGKENIAVERLDVRDARSIQKLADRLSERGETLSLLINNAGMLIPEDFGNWSPGAFEDTLRTNVLGPGLVIQTCANLLKEGSKVVNISSGLGSLSLEYNFGGETGTYAISKAALNMITCHAAAALKERGIIVISQNPGWVRTDMGGSAATLHVSESVANMRSVFASLELEQSGTFLEYNGVPMAW